MKKILFMFTIVSFGLFLQAQNVFDKPNFNPNYQLGSLFNPNIVKMNHSMSFMSGVSSNGEGFYESAYTNHLKFQLRDNLRLNVDLSVLNIGTMTHNNDMKFNARDDNQNMVVPAVSLQYKPSENSTIFFEYRQIRGYQYPYPRNTNWWDD